jgi:hypothetical protein
VITFNGRSSNSTVIDAVTLKIIGTIPLAGKPEFSQADGNGKIFVNIEDKSLITIINSVTLKVVQQVSADEYKVLENFPTFEGARTITVNKTTHHIYLPTAELLPGEGRRQSKPNTFKVVDIEPVK